MYLTPISNKPYFAGNPTSKKIGKTAAKIIAAERKLKQEDFGETEFDAFRLGITKSHLQALAKHLITSGQICADPRIKNIAETAITFVYPKTNL